MITVLRAGALGDILLTLPALHALRAHCPHTSLRVIGYPAIWSVAGKLVGDIRSIDSPEAATLYLHGKQPPNWLADTDLLIAWSARPLPGLTGATFPFRQTSPYPPPGVHAAQWLLNTLSESDILPVHAVVSLANVNVLPGGVTVPSFFDFLLLTDVERTAGRHDLDMLGVHRPLLIHPGAGASWKRWPAKRFTLLANWGREQGRQVALVEGPADASVVAAVQESLDTSVPVIREPNLRRLAAILAAGSHFVGNDSGVTHLAAMAGVPTIALFGPTDPASWAPLGRVTVLRGCECVPSEQGQIRVCHDPRCLEAIDLGRVTAVLQSAV